MAAGAKMVMGAYKPPNPMASTLYQCVEDHFTEFERIYGERYQEQYSLYRPAIGSVVEKSSAAETSPGASRGAAARVVGTSICWPSHARVGSSSLPATRSVSSP